MKCEILKFEERWKISHNKWHRYIWVEVPLWMLTHMDFVNWFLYHLAVDYVWPMVSLGRRWETEKTEVRIFVVLVASLRGSHPLTEGHLESQPILKSFSFKVSVTSSSPYPFEHRLVSTLFPLFFTRVFVNNPFVNKIQVILIDVYHLLNSLIPISLRVKDIMCYTALYNPPPKAMTSLISFLFYCSLTSTLASCDSSNTPDCLLVWNDFPPSPAIHFVTCLPFSSLCWNLTI